MGFNSFLSSFMANADATGVHGLVSGALAPSRPPLTGIFDKMGLVVEGGRRAVQEPRAPQQHSASLGYALADVPNDLCLPAAVEFTVFVVGKPRELTPEVSDELYSIGREAIVNAYRHSGARQIETEIEYRPTEVRIAVRDNGCGIDPDQLQWRRSRHWGLRRMRERAERIGAQQAWAAS